MRGPHHPRKVTPSLSTPGLTIHPVHLRAPAKVNLALAVGGPYPPHSDKPGFHPIASWMSCVDFHDEIMLESLPEGSPAAFSIRWAADAPRPSTIDWEPSSDLTVRALRELETRIGRHLPVRIDVTKRIPVGGGLGGGSSDAAAVLQGLDKLFSLRLQPADLLAVASKLGSDIAFFLDPGHDTPRPALVTGLGDQIDRLPRVGANLVLVIPPFACPTAGVYAAYDKLLRGEVAVDRAVTAESRPTANVNEPLVRLIIRRCIESGRIDPGVCFNALTAPAAHLEPRVAAVIEAVTTASGMQAHLSGSGSTVFVVGPPDAARIAETQLAAHLVSDPVLATCRLLRARLI